MTIFQILIMIIITLANMVGWFLYDYLKTNNYKFEFYRIIRIRTRKQKKLMNYINDADKTCKLKLEKYKDD